MRKSVSSRNMCLYQINLGTKKTSIYKPVQVVNLIQANFGTDELRRKFSKNSLTSAYVIIYHSAEFNIWCRSSQIDAQVTPAPKLLGPNAPKFQHFRARKFENIYNENLYIAYIAHSLFYIAYITLRKR